MIWPWKRKSTVVEEEKIKETFRLLYQEMTERPEYKAASLIEAALRETLKKLFGNNREAGREDAILQIVCENLYCAACLTFSAFSAVEATTAKERTELLTKWNVEGIELLLLEPGFVIGVANNTFSQMWNSLMEEKLRTEQPTGYAKPIEAVKKYVHKILPVVADTVQPKDLLTLLPSLYADMEYLLESLVFTCPELFQPAVSVIGGNISATSGYGLGLVEHYSCLDKRRAERATLRKTQQAEYCELVNKIEKFTHSRRESVS